jgi:hypothetical protein
VLDAEVVPSSKISKFRGSPKSIGNSSLMIDSFVRVRQSGYIAYMKCDLGCRYNIDIIVRTSIANNSSATIEAHSWKPGWISIIEVRKPKYYELFLVDEQGSFLWSRLRADLWPRRSERPESRSTTRMSITMFLAQYQ